MGRPAYGPQQRIENNAELLPAWDDASISNMVLASAPELVASSSAGSDASISTARIPLTFCGQPLPHTVTHINTSQAFENICLTVQ